MCDQLYFVIEHHDENHGPMPLAWCFELCLDGTSEIGTVPAYYAPQRDPLLPLGKVSGKLYQWPTSSEFINMVRTWTEDCVTSHVKCATDMDDTLPERVLDLGAFDDGETVKLLGTSGRGGRYIALSYCWGEKMPPTTTLHNRAQHEQGIRLSELPMTYRDAVRVARSLSIRYLWIDSLCIVQDDDGDRERQLGRMAEIFSKAFLVLICADASDPYEGFLHDRPLMYLWSEATPIQS